MKDIVDCKTSPLTPAPRGEGQDSVDRKASPWTPTPRGEDQGQCGLQNLSLGLLVQGDKIKDSMTSL